MRHRNLLPRWDVLAGGLCTALAVVLVTTACGGIEGGGEAHASSTTLEDSWTLGQLAEFAGGEPVRCVFASPHQQLCTWQLDASSPGYATLAEGLATNADLNLVCELPIGEGPRAAGSCLAHVDVIGDLPPVGAEAGDPAAQSQASRALDTATTIVALSHLLGDVPDACRTGPGIQTCHWDLASGSTGHSLASTLANTDGDVVLSCVLPLDGSPRESGSCDAEPAAAD